MCKKDIVNSIYGILEEKLKLKLNIDREESQFKNLFCKEIHLEPRDMVYLIYFIEKKYEIKFSDIEMDEMNFYTIDGLSDIVMKHISDRK